MPSKSCCRLLLTLCFGLTLVACGKPADSQKPEPHSTLIGVTIAKNMVLESREEAIGTLEGLVDPIVSAEVAGRVLSVGARPGQHVKKGAVLVILDPTDLALQRQEAQAEVGRLEALLANQERTLKRNQALVEKNFISKNALDDVATQESALRNELEAARIRLSSIEHTGSKTRAVAPVDGIIEKQIVTPGDFVTIGAPLMQIFSNQRLRAHLPFPERTASHIKPGLKVRLTTPTSSTEVVSEVSEMKAVIGESNRAIDVLVDVFGYEGWQAGASVKGVVILGQKDAVTVPEQSIVLRPAGEVVYVIKDGQAEQRIVKTGMYQEGVVEIIEGVAAGETVAVDGASFLTDKAPVTIQGETETQESPAS